MTLQQVYKIYLDELEGIYSKGEIRNIFSIIISRFLNIDLIYLQLHPNEELIPPQQNLLSGILNRLKKHEPVQYITGTAYFDGMELSVTPHTLIPRPETEELVELITNFKSWKPNLSILDIGTGSGCIALAMAKRFPDSQITAIDLSDEALITAESNTRKHGFQINFMKDDILSPQHISGKSFDIIVSNPPYIPDNEMKSMHRNILDFEPHRALFVPENSPLIFYHAIAGFAKRSLNPRGSLFLEIHEKYAMETAELLTSKGFSVKNHKDFLGKERFISGQKVTSL